MLAGEFRAEDAALDQVELEGAPFWLCRLLEPPFQAAAPIVFAGESFDQGFWLVKIQWLEFASLDSAKQRRYRLGEERKISVHSLVRFRAVKMCEPAAAEPRGRGRPAAAASPVKLLLLKADECAQIVEHTEIQNFL